MDPAYRNPNHPRSFPVRSHPYHTIPYQLLFLNLSLRIKPVFTPPLHLLFISSRKLPVTNNNQLQSLMLLNITKRLLTNSSRNTSQIFLSNSNKISLCTLSTNMCQSISIRHNRCRHNSSPHPIRATSEGQKLPLHLLTSMRRRRLLPRLKIVPTAHLVSFLPKGTSKLLIRTPSGTTTMHTMIGSMNHTPHSSRALLPAIP
jgi:hypothetical protein